MTPMPVEQREAAVDTVKKARISYGVQNAGTYTALDLHEAHTGATQRQSTEKVLPCKIA